GAHLWGAETRVTDSGRRRDRLPITPSLVLELLAALLLGACWRRFFGRAEADGAARVTEPREGSVPQFMFWAALAVTMGMFYWLYLAQLFVIEDPNAEAMESPLAVALLEQARATGRPANVFWREDPLVAHWKEQDPVYTKAPLGRFKMQWTGQAHPLLNFCYVPFIKALGVNRKAIACYSTFFGIIAWVGTGLLAWRMFGCWCGPLAAALMATALGWLIHVRVGYHQPVPSVALMVLLACCLYSYWRNQKRWALMLSGCLLGLMYLAGWIVILFGLLLAGAALVFGGPRRLMTVAFHGLCMAGCAVVVAVVVAWLYAARYDFPASEIHETIREMTLGRYKEGEPGLLKLSASGKMAYAFTCLFWDSRTLDGHVDKYLEGHPAIPWVFSAFLWVGLLFAIWRGGIADQVLLFWMLAVLGVLGLLFIYGHRYALVGLPALSIVAARGISACGSGWRKPLSLYWGIGVGVMLLATAWSTHTAFYSRYLRQKEANFEMDRMRGHHAFVEWLGRGGKPEETLVVLSDTIMFPPTCYVFNTYGQRYAWVYWSNYFRTGSPPEQVRAWEKQQPSHIRRIVYAFSPTLLGDPQRGLYVNDPRPFFEAHPDLKPCWTYSYAGRPPLILAFEVRR
ncbi:MAG: hypothetical protein N2689_09725, partial [Verrucomicrobiae bacterium]|nr:hypothetical protein [Verrucomicrobiae bacterium]